MPLQRCFSYFLNDTSPARHSYVVRYLAAIGIVGIALLARSIIAPGDAALPYLTFFPAVTLVSILFGLGPGLLSAVLSTAVVEVMFLPAASTHSFALWSQAVFMANAFLVCGAVDAMHRYYAQYQRMLSQSLLTNKTLEAEIDGHRKDEVMLGQNLAVTNVLSEILRLSLTDAPLEHILDTALEKLLSLSWLKLEDKGNIFLANSDRQSLSMVAQRNLPPQIKERCARIAYGFCLCGQAAEQQRTIFKPHLDADHIVTHDGIVDHGHFCVPIRSGERTLGVINIYVIGGHQRDDKEEFYLNMFADTLAGIIERKQAELSLRESKDLANALLNASADAVLLMDRAGTLLTLNQSMATRFNSSIEQMMGKSLYDMISADLAATRRATITQALDTGVPQFVQDVRDDLVLDNRMYPVKGADGTCSSVAIFSRDVTEMYKAESAIRDLAAYQPAILQNCPIGWAVLGVDRNILQVNPAFARIYGREGEDLIGKNARILYGDQDQFKDIGQRAYPLVQSGASFNDDVRMARWDGSEIWVRLTAKMVDISKPSLGVVWAAEDITIRKSLELELTRSNEDLERFAYVASHDLRQPLRMVNSYLSLIERKLTDTLDDECKSFLGYAMGGAKRMDRMIVDLLDYSRISRIATEKTLVSLETLANFALKNLERAIQEADAEITIATALPQIYGYESELERLLQNLIGNALKFRAQDRPIKVTLGCRETARHWILSIADTGIGIDPKDHGRLFGVFQRLVSQSQYEGNGIGLAACRKIVEHHDGKIWIESQLDQGCTFFISLPKSACTGT